tara:strand:- start:2107 stop:2415 length:309 start_codon:yes stop_codon:yes gene_type:complete
MSSVLVDLVSIRAIMAAASTLVEVAFIGVETTVDLIVAVTVVTTADITQADTVATVTVVSREATEADTVTADIVEVTAMVEATSGIVVTPGPEDIITKKFAI